MIVDKMGRPLPRRLCLVIKIFRGRKGLFQFFPFPSNIHQHSVYTYFITIVMSRILTAYSRKQQLRNFFNSPIYGDDACPLCENNETPSNLNLHLNESSNSKTCGDVHLELSLIKQSTQPDLCDAKQQLYRTKCCPEGESENSMKPGIGTALGFLLIIILIKRILSIRVRVDTIDVESVSSSTYEQMEDAIKAKDSHSVVKQIIVDSRTQLV